MKARDLGALFALAALWGGAFLFIRVAVPAIGPVPLAEARVTLAGAALLLYALVMRADLGLRRRWKSYLIMGALQAAIPYSLISAAELHLTSGLAAILNATTPLFGALVAAVWMRERLTLTKGVGLLLGLVGVAVVTGWSALPWSLTTALAIGASLLAAFVYGIAGNFARRAFAGVPPLASSTGQQLGAAVLLLPIALPVAATSAPWTHLSPSIAWAVLALAFGCTSVAFLFYFYLISSVGAVSTLSVTFLAPVFALLWGALFLSERITSGSLVGMAIIFAGVLLVMGMRLPRVARAARAPRDSASEQTAAAEGVR
ncbi:MAG TPA: DMT family transporter [Ktedonobacterales bacterium]|nr:DMT family transporter [Ktedonobacterales bacterium]